MLKFRNIILSSTPPSIYDLWIKEIDNTDNPLEIRIYKNHKWELVNNTKISDLSDYYTKLEINNIIGDINTILESIING